MKKRPFRSIAEDQRLSKLTKAEFAGEQLEYSTRGEMALYKMVQDAFPKAGFKPQEIVCGYIPDMYSSRHKIAIEVDGRIHQRMSQYMHDQQKDLVLLQRGIRVLRFTESQVIRAASLFRFGVEDQVINTIRRYLKSQ